MAEANGDATATNGTASGNPPSPAAAATSQPTPTPAPAAPTAPANPLVPPISGQDTGLSKRPRDARLIHLLLSSIGVSAYQERVPLQLMDFAYRHQNAILSDALHLSSDAYVSQQNRARDAPAGGFRDPEGQVTPQAVQLAIQSRLQYQFAGGNGLSKEFLMETALARNKVQLPRVLQNEWGVRLPSERFVLTGVPWGLKDEWESPVTQDEDAMDGIQGMESIDGGGMEGMENGEEEGNEEGGNIDDVFGVDNDFNEEAMEE